MFTASDSVAAELQSAGDLMETVWSATGGGGGDTLTDNPYLKLGYVVRQLCTWLRRASAVKGGAADNGATQMPATQLPTQYVRVPERYSFADPHSPDFLLRYRTMPVCLNLVWSVVGLMSLPGCGRALRQHVFLNSVASVARHYRG